VTVNSRNSKAYLSDADGVVHEFDANTTARLNGLGAYFGGAFINKIRNPRGEGGTVGIIGSGGVLPTNWANTASAGLSIEVVATGTRDGIPYTRLRYFGTTTSASAIKLRFDDSTNATASAGQAWGIYAWLQKVSGTVPSMYVVATSFAAGSSLAEFATGTSAAPTTTRALYSAKGVIARATTDNARASLNSAVLTDATAYDFTIDIYAPQLLNIAVVTDSELIVNGTGLTTTDNWTNGSPGNWTLGTSGGNLTLENTVTGFAYAYQAVTIEPEAVYKVSAMSGPEGSASVNIGTTPNGSDLTYFALSGANASGSSFFKRNGTTVYFTPKNTTSTVGAVRSVGAMSLKKQTAGYLPSYPILPPVGVPGDSVQYADNVTAPSFDWFAAAGLDVSGFAFLVTVDFSHVGDGVSRRLAVISDGTDNNRAILGIGADDLPNPTIKAAGATTVSLTLPTPITATRMKFAGVCVAGAWFFAASNGDTNSSAVGAAGTGFNALHIGQSRNNTSQLNDIIEQLQVCRPLTQAQAEAWVNS